MTQRLLFIVFLLTIAVGCKNTPDSAELWAHVPFEVALSNSQGIKAEFSHEKGDKSLHIQLTNPSKYNWCSIPEPDEGWDLTNKQSIEANFHNAGDTPLKVILWVIAKNGWTAVADAATLDPSEDRVLSCKLRDTFSDGTYKINPDKVQEIRFMLINPKKNSNLIVSKLNYKGEAPLWQAPKDRIEVPELENNKPQAGKRVRYQPDCAKRSNKYIALYLPSDWKPEKKYPVIVEFPGNIYFTKNCYSTGLPESCVIGYGMTKGKGAIWISMPFVDNESNENTVNGWGNPDHTADFTVATINEIIAKFGGNKDRMVLTGFSRGAIACGFIGLRNPKIASLWKGLHACQHYDGDNWQKASMDGAKERIKYFKGSYFQTDNKGEEPKKMLDEAGVKSTFVNSGLGAHSSSMFLDDRESTQKLRKWYHEIIK